MSPADQWADVCQGLEPDDMRRSGEPRDVGRPARPDDAGRSDRARFGEDADADHLRARPPGSRSASNTGFAGKVHLIVPLHTLLGMAEQPGEVPGHGAVPASVARAIAATATGRPWCYTVIDQSGCAVGHGHIPSPLDGDDATSREALTGLITAHLGGLETRHGCGHGPNSADGPDNRHIQGAYRPPEALRHRVEVRDRTCRFPTCRRPAEACDLDHTVPYDEDGATCDCNLAPLCRKHHRLKQSAGWALLHPEPGRLIWVTPTGRKYLVSPDPYA